MGITQSVRRAVQQNPRGRATVCEAVHAIVIVKDGEQVPAEELIAHCHRLIAGYKCPRSIEFRREPFPLSGAGKVLKRELRAPHWKGRSRQVN